MEAPFFTQWISGQLMNAICWTLIHSLWIGMLVAVLTGGVITGMQKASSRLRYRVLCGCLLLFVGSTGFAFYKEITSYNPSQINSTSTVVAPGYAPYMAQERNVGIISESTPIVNQLTTFINQQTGWIFAIWLVFFVVKSLKLISGLYYVHRIQNHKVYTPGDEWKAKVLVFSQMLGIQRTVTLVQSELVNVPVTVGFLKPVILVPMGLLFQLPPEQIDTILWHELAHIWRRDYLMNLLQSLVEAVFFFNPALLWLSALIREERETCCDDIVLAHTTRKSNYLEALLAFQASNSQPVAYNVALGFGSHQLMNRLKRMVNQENKRLSVVEKIVLLSGFILLSATSFISKTASETKKPTIILHKTTGAQVIGKPATVPIRNVYSVKAHPPNKSRQIVTLPVVNITAAIPTDTTRTFTSILFAHSNEDMANRDMTVRDDKGNRYHLKIVDNQLVTLEVNGIIISENERDRYKELLPQIDRKLIEKRQEKHAAITEFNAKAAEERQRQLDKLKEAQQAKASRQQQAKQYVAGVSEKQWPTGVTKQKRILTETSQPEKLLSDKKRRNFQRDTSATLHITRTKKDTLVFDNSKDQERVRGVIAALVQEKIVADQAAVEWFGLSDDELIVNGNKQPEALHQKLKAIYGIKSRFGLYYGPVKIYGTGVFLDKGDL